LCLQVHRRNRGFALKRNAMAEYRAYIVGMDGRIVRAVELLCPDDDTAKEYAKNLVDGHDVELWQDRRKIAKFDHKPH
jgi:hypothetical protein